MTLEHTAPEKPFPYVKFACMKRVGGRDPNTNEEKIKEVPSVWYLNVRGCHNQVTRIVDLIKLGNKVLGYGNLNNSRKMRNGIEVPFEKFDAIRDLIDGITGKRHDARLEQFEENPKALEQKVANETKRVRA